MEPGLKEVIVTLRRVYGFTLPTTDDDWTDMPKVSIDVRREFVALDGMKEARMRPSY